MLATALRPIALAGVITISWSAIIVRLAEVSPATVTFFRALLALPALALLWLAVRSRDRRPLPARALAFTAGLFLAIDLTLWHHSIDAIGAGLATVLAATQVVFVPLAAWLIHRERPPTAVLAIAPVVFAGVVLLSGLGRDDAYGDDPVRGVIFGLLTGIFYAGFIFTLRASNRSHLAPTPGPLLDATAGTALTAAVIGAFEAGFDLRPGWPAIGWLLVLALLTQVLGWLMISYALPRLAALETSVMLLVQPAAAVLWARLVFGEYLSPVQWAGMVLVLGGILAISLAARRRPVRAWESRTLQSQQG